LVHHLQNCRGDFDTILQEGYAQEDSHLRKLEEEAYLLSAITFRDWEDGIKDKYLKNSTVDESSAVAGGAVVGYTSPLGANMSSAHELMWSDEKISKKK
jgi:hypothetical protein